MQSKQIFYNVGANGDEKALLDESPYMSKYNLTNNWTKQNDWKKYVILVPLYSFFFFWFFTFGTSYLEHFRTFNAADLQFSFMIIFGQGAYLYILIMLMGDIYWDVTGIAFLFNSFIPKRKDKVGWKMDILGGVLAFIFGLFGAWFGSYLAGLPHDLEFGQPDNIFGLESGFLFMIIFVGDIVFQWVSYHFASSPSYKKAVALSIGYIAIRLLFGFQTGGLFSFIIYFGTSINELAINGNDFPFPAVHLLSIIIASVVAFIINFLICKPSPRKYMTDEKYEMRTAGN